MRVGVVMTDLKDSRAYSFRLSARAPTENADLVREHLSAAHRYYNALVEIERWRRSETERFWAERGGYAATLDEIATLTATARALPKGPERLALYRQVDGIKAEVRRLQRETGLAQCPTPEARRRKERAREMRAEAKARGQKLTDAELAAMLDREPDCVSPRDRLRLAIAAEYAARGVAVSGKVMVKRLRDAGLATLTDEIEQAAKARDYAAYQASGLSFGTRAVVVEAFSRAVKDSAPEAPAFKRFDEHAVSVGVDFKFADKFTGHLLFNGGNTRVSIERAGDPAGMQAGSRRSGRRAVLRLRIASNADKSPVWASFPIMLDRRKIPPEARVSNVRVSRARVGVHDRWSVVICVSLPAVAPAAPTRSGAVAIDLTWRRLNSGAIRSAYWADEHGLCGSVELDEKTLRAFDKARDVQGVNSRLLHTSVSGVEGGIVVELANWLSTRDTLPEWLAAVAPHVRRWRSGARLNRLVEHWHSNRFDGDEEMFAEMDAWRRTWRHLFEWGERGRENALARRLEIFRLAIKPLVERYGTVIVRGLKLADMKRRKRADQTDLVLVDDNVRSVMQLAAPGIFREQIAGIAKRRGRHVITLDHDALPTRCHACGGTCAWDRKAHLAHECEHCGAEWDQHYNVARNMLDLYRERFGDAKKPAVAREVGEPSKSAGKKSGNSVAHGSEVRRAVERSEGRSQSAW